MSLRLLKLLSADTTVTGAVINILRLTQRFENILSKMNTSNAFDSTNATVLFHP